VRATALRVTPDVRAGFRLLRVPLVAVLCVNVVTQLDAFPVATVLVRVRAAVCSQLLQTIRTPRSASNVSTRNLPCMATKCSQKSAIRPTQQVPRPAHVDGSNIVSVTLSKAVPQHALHGLSMPVSDILTISLKEFRVLRTRTLGVARGLQPQLRLQPCVYTRGRPCAANCVVHCTACLRIPTFMCSPLILMHCVTPMNWHVHRCPVCKLQTEQSTPLRSSLMVLYKYTHAWTEAVCLAPSCHKLLAEHLAWLLPALDLCRHGRPQYAMICVDLHSTPEVVF
jgi:hypothetical protein